MSIITIEAVFDTTKEKVWEAITQPEIMKIWYFDIANFNLNVGMRSGKSFGHGFVAR